MVVLLDGPAAAAFDRKSRSGATAQLDFLSSNSVHIAATGSGHEIHLYQPQRVVEAVMKAVLAVRNRAPVDAR